MPDDDPTMARLDDQIEWYDRKSSSNQRTYKALKITVIVLAALLPLLSALPFPIAPPGIPNWVLGAIGAVIAVIEGIQQVNQYHANWIAYRSTCEALKHDKYLYLANAGPYAAATTPRGLLAERIESLVSQEHAKWASVQAAADKAPAKTEPQKA